MSRDLKEVSNEPYRYLEEENRQREGPEVIARLVYLRNRKVASAA